MAVTLFRRLCSTQDPQERQSPGHQH
jgi:hypothetical protein